jgi:ABC-2 type transport system ATP-binding protein
VLVLDDVSKSFGAVRALDSCSFSVAPGRLVGFLGPNGAGKTTAMRTVFGLVTPDSGTVTWNGGPIGLEQRLRFGYMPEQRGLYPKMKARDQIAYLGRLHGMDSSEAMAGADRWLERFGLSDRGRDTVETLSHGNQQRVQLAAALVHDPELLVLDEPFSGLDPIAVETMSDVLREQTATGRAVVFSSHQLDLVEDLCEEVAIINRGRIVVDGNVKQLKDSSPFRHIELDIDGAMDGLLETLGGVIDHRHDGSHHSITVDAGTDIRAFVAGAQEAGRVRHFSYTTPSLSDLFREAVR